jgi:hypothetical protein
MVFVPDGFDMAIQQALIVPTTLNFAHLGL